MWKDDIRQVTWVTNWLWKQLNRTLMWILEDCPISKRRDVRFQKKKNCKNKGFSGSIFWGQWSDPYGAQLDARTFEFVPSNLSFWIWWISGLYIFKYICMDIYIHTHIHIYTYKWRTCWAPLQVYMRIYIYIHINIHTCMYTHMYTYIHIFIYLYTRAHTSAPQLSRSQCVCWAPMQVYIRTYKQINIHTCIHTYILIWTYAYTYVHTHTRAPPNHRGAGVFVELFCRYTYVYTHINTNIHTCIHTCVNT